MDSPLSLDALRVLDAIDREGSFAGAARRLHRVPSAITYTVQRLEEDLGVALFDRSGHRAQLTEAGRLVLTRGRSLTAGVDALRAAARSLAEGWEPRLTITFDSLLQRAPLVELIETFSRSHGEVAVTVTEEVLDGHWDALESGRAELAVGAVGTPPRGIATAPLPSPRWLLVCAPDHPATRLPSPVSSDALSAFTSVVAADSARQRAARTVGVFADQPNIAVPHLEWKLALHRAGTGVGWAPAHQVADDLAAGRLVALTPREPRPVEATSIAWRRGARGRALQWFRERLCTADAGSALVPASDGSERAP